ncbi:MAG TPA: hypothetical protein VHJ18_14160 [Streptosporangiaceae bacterium]|nr:hypothetical protein [Streptosporangiaceae bacterium]
MPHPEIYTWAEQRCNSEGPMNSARMSIRIPGRGFRNTRLRYPPIAENTPERFNEYPAQVLLPHASLPAAGGQIKYAAFIGMLQLAWLTPAELACHHHEHADTEARRPPVRTEASAFPCLPADTARKPRFPLAENPMTGPPWLAGVLATLMILVAAAAAARPGLTALQLQSPESAGSGCRGGNTVRHCAGDRPGCHWPLAPQEYPSPLPR